MESKIGLKLVLKNKLTDKESEIYWVDDFYYDHEHKHIVIHSYGLVTFVKHIERFIIYPVLIIRDEHGVVHEL